MAKTFRISWEPKPDRAIARVIRVKRFGASTKQLEWPAFPSGARLREQIGVHVAQSEEPIAEWIDDKTALSVSHGWIASLSEADAAGLDLPPTTKLAIELQSIGVPSNHDFRIDRRLVSASGVEAYRTVIGAFLKIDDRLERLPSPLYEIESAAAPLRRADADQPARLGRLETLTRALENAGADVRADKFLENLRIFYASALSLSLRAEDDNFDFDPVLFGRSASAAAIDGATLDEDDDALLSPALQSEFLREFKRRGETMKAASLGNGAFVYLDPGVAKAVALVAEKKKAGREERKSFALNPRRIFKDALAASASNEAEIDTLFIETDQFSKRVLAIDVWRAPVLPWIKPKPNTWLPERFGLKVGDAYVEVEPESAVDLVHNLTAAAVRGDPAVEFAGVSIPATAQSIEAAQEIAQFANRTQDSPSDELSDSRLAATVAKRFLIINENFEELTYELRTEYYEPLPAEIKAPAALRSTFKRHQIDGFRWLASARVHDSKGALLADDMGLGKTLQALAFIAWRKEQAQRTLLQRKPTVIVAPTALQDNWLREMVIHFEASAFENTQKVTGTFLNSIKRGGRDVIAGVGTLDTDRLRGFDVLITTYETLRDYHISFARIAFDVAIFDEVQKLKNPASQVTRTAKTVNAEFILSMTGTPVENRLHDLWSVMDVTWPGRLGSSKEFASRYDEGSKDDLRVLNDLLAKPSGKRPPIMLRRLKADEIDGLPTKTTTKRRMAMPPAQAEAYSDVLRRVRAEKSRGAILKALHDWRSISVHPHAPPHAFHPNDAPLIIAQSARFQLTFEFLQEIAVKAEKALIFIEDLEWQGWLANAIRTRFGLVDNPPIINGSVPGPRRQAIVDKFESGPRGFNVLILSPRAAGVGLNIVSANHVIHLSRWWNPAVEDQATDRVYRIGQTRPVNVYIPLAVHPAPSIEPASFDLKLDELMGRKRTLSGTFLAPSEASDDELERFFSGLIPSESIDTPTKPTPVESPAPQTDPPRDLLPVGSSTAISSAAANEARPIAAALSVLAHGKLIELWIEDPYFACSNVHEVAAEFVRNKIIMPCGSLNKLRLRALDPDHPKIRAQMNGEGKGAIKARLCTLFGMPIDFRWDGPSTKFFHDRSIIFVLATRCGQRTIRWNLPGGIEHWLDQRRPTQATQQIVESAPRWL